jgi:hypothetical protein
MMHLAERMALELMAVKRRHQRRPGPDPDGVLRKPVVGASVHSAPGAVLNYRAARWGYSVPAPARFNVLRSPACGLLCDFRFRPK